MDNINDILQKHRPPGDLKSEVLNWVIQALFKIDEDKNNFLQTGVSTPDGTKIRNFTQLKNYLNTHGFNIPENITIKNLAILLENWKEEVANRQNSSDTKLDAQKDENINQTTPGEEILESQEPERKIEQEKEIRQKVRENVAAGLNRQEELARERRQRKEEVERAKREIGEKIKQAKVHQVDIKNQPVEKIFVKVTKEQVNLDKNQQEAFEVIKNAAIENPQEISSKLSQKIQGSIRGIDPLTADYTATEVVKGLVNFDKPSYIPPIVSGTIIERVAQNNIQDKGDGAKLSREEELIKQSQGEFSSYAKARMAIIKLPREISELVFGPEFTKLVLGPDSKDIQVEIVFTESQSTHSIDPQEINTEVVKGLERQVSILDSIETLGQDEAKNFLKDQANKLINKEIASLSKNNIGGLAGKVLKSDEALSIFYNTFGIGKEVAWEGTGPVSRLITRLFPEYSPFLSAIQKITGLDFGIRQAIVATAVETTTASTAGATIAVTTESSMVASSAIVATSGVATTGTAAVATTGTGVIAGGVGSTVAKTGLAAVIAKIATVSAVVINVVAGAIIAAIALIAKNWQKITKWIKENAGYVAMMVAASIAVVGGAKLGILGGVTTYVLIKRSIRSLFTGLFKVISLALLPLSVSLIPITIIILFTVFTLFIINNGAYVVPKGQALSGGIANPYVGVTKTASPSGPFENTDLPFDVDYTVTITAKISDLKNVRIDYDCEVLKVGTKVSCPDSKPKIPANVDSIATGSNYTFSYKHSYTSGKFEDSFVTDTITVTADTDEAVNQVASTSLTIKIGNPPEDCPFNKWPTDSGYITQGAYTPDSCGTHCSHNTTESIDIGVSGVNVYATHTGTIVRAEFDSCYGNRVEIKSTCQGKEFISRYAHLEGISVKNGATVTVGQTIGLSGNTGSTSCTTGPHLHYEFKYTSGSNPKYPNDPPFMWTNYIPVNIPRGCTDRGICNVSY